MSTPSRSSSSKPSAAGKRRAVLVANGDLREEANRVCWPAQQAMEVDLVRAFAAAGWKLERGHAASKARGHGFIASAREGIDVFASVDSSAPLVVAEGHGRGEGGLASAGRLVVEFPHGGGHFGENFEPVMPGQHAQGMHRRGQKPAPGDPPDERFLLLRGNLRRGEHSQSTSDLGQNIADECGHFVDHLATAASRVGRFQNCLGIDTGDPLGGGIEAGLMVGGGGSVGHAGANASVRGV